MAATARTATLPDGRMALTYTGPVPDGAEGALRTEYYRPTSEADTWIRECPWCTDGIRPLYRYHRGGVCFHCDGHATTGAPQSAKQAAAGFTRRTRDRIRRAAAKHTRAAARKGDGEAFLAAHPEFAAARKSWISQMADEEAAARMERLAGRDFAVLVRVSSALARFGTVSPKEAEAFVAAFAAVQGACAQAAEKADRGRYAADVGAQVEVTGTAVHVREVQGRYGAQTMIVVEGSGPDEGVVLTAYTAAAWGAVLARGEGVTVRGCVSKRYSNDRGAKVTVVKRPVRVA